MISSGQNQTPEGVLTLEPVVETLDLLQTGNLTNPYIANITKDFHVVTKMNWILSFTDISVDWTNFAAGTVLSNGIFIDYSDFGNLLDNNITNNHELMTLAYNAHYFEDDQNPKGNIIWVQHLLTSFIEGGIKIDNSHTIQIYIQDDLNDAGLSIDSFTVTLKGYKLSAGSFSFEGQETINYGNGHKATIRIEGLEIGQEYVLMIANNTLSAYNITWTANRNIAQVDFDYSGIKIDNNNNTLQELEIILVELADTQEIKFTYYLQIKYFGLNEFLNWIGIIGGIIIVVFFTMIILLAFIERK